MKHPIFRCILLTDELQQVEQKLGQLIIAKTHDNVLVGLAANSPGDLAVSFAVTSVSLYEMGVDNNNTVNNP